MAEQQRMRKEERKGNDINKAPLMYLINARQSRFVIRFPVIQVAKSKFRISKAAEGLQTHPATVNHFSERGKIDFPQISPDLAMSWLFLLPLSRLVSKTQLDFRFSIPFSVAIRKSSALGKRGIALGVRWIFFVDRAKVWEKWVTLFVRGTKNNWQRSSWRYRGFASIPRLVKSHRSWPTFSLNCSPELGSVFTIGKNRADWTCNARRCCIRRFPFFGGAESD